MSGYIGRLPLTEAIQTRKSFVATAGQTTFSMAYQAGYIDVYLNGIKIREGASEDYVASNGTSIVLNSGVVVNTELDVVSLTSASIVDKLPTQSSSTNGKILQSDGTNASWATDSNTTYSVGDGGLSEINFTSADHSKLNGIEAGATADQTGAQILALFSNSITAGHIAAGAIGASELGNDVVNSQHYAAGSIDNEHIADNAINSEHYAAGSIDNEHMAANSINSDQYVDGSIDRVHLAADIIDGTKIANDVINSEHYVAGSIDNEHISGMAASKLSGALPAIDGSSLTGVSETRATAYVQTATNRTINSSTTWTTHQTKTVTLGGVGDVRMSFVAASGYESGNVQGEFRFKCGSNLSPTMSLWNQFSQNKGHGSHGGVWEFTSIAAGSTVCELQVRNVGASSNIIMNYWDTEADTFMVNYPS